MNFMDIVAAPIDFLADLEGGPMTRIAEMILLFPAILLMVVLLFIFFIPMMINYIITGEL